MIITFKCYLGHIGGLNIIMNRSLFRNKNCYFLEWYINLISLIFKGTLDVEEEISVGLVLFSFKHSLCKNSKPNQGVSKDNHSHSSLGSSLYNTSVLFLKILGVIYSQFPLFNRAGNRWRELSFFEIPRRKTLTDTDERPCLCTCMQTGGRRWLNWLWFPRSDSPFPHCFHLRMSV